MLPPPLRTTDLYHLALLTMGLRRAGWVPGQNWGSVGNAEVIRGEQGISSLLNTGNIWKYLLIAFPTYTYFSIQIRIADLPNGQNSIGIDNKWLSFSSHRCYSALLCQCSFPHPRQQLTQAVPQLLQTRWPLTISVVFSSIESTASSTSRFSLA